MIALPMIGNRAGAARGAFTMIELLTVITIIGLLASMLLVAIPWIQYSSRALQTTTRMEAITQAFTRLGQQEGSATYVLQRDANPISGTADYLGGTPIFTTLLGQQVATPQSGAWHICFPPDPGVGKPLVLAYPWGKNRLYYIMEPWYASKVVPNLPTSFDTDPVIAKTQRDLWEKPEPHNLIELRPFRTIELLRTAGILLHDDPSTTGIDEGVDAYMKDRGRSQTWNDGWGNPLVVGIALFQPPQCTIPGAAGANPGDPPLASSYKADYYLKESIRVYQYNRSVFISVAAAGPTLRKPQLASTTLSDWTGSNLPDIWIMANEVCQKATTSWTPGMAWTPRPDGAWDETSFDRPPWQGVKRGLKKEAGKELRPLLTAPIELH